jgi:hypothetical protein
MIILDFRVVDVLGSIPRSGLRDMTEASIATDLFQAYLVFKINDADLSWNKCIPMVDFARTLFVAASSLSAEEPEHQFISVELEPWWTFHLNANDRVTVSRDGCPFNGDCDRDELVRATAAYGVRVFDSLVSALPDVRDSPFLSHWYPYDAMCDTATL